MLLGRWADAEHLRRFMSVLKLLQHVGEKNSKGWGYEGSELKDPRLGDMIKQISLNRLKVGLVRSPWLSLRG